MADARGCKIGAMLAVKNARPHRFLDGQLGIRIEDPSHIEVLSHTLYLTKHQVSDVPLTENSMLNERFLGFQSGTPKTK